MQEQRSRSNSTHTSSWFLLNPSVVSMGLSFFLVVALALTFQQTYRLNTEIERLHWQLSFAQFTNTKNTQEHANQDVLYQRLEKLLTQNGNSENNPQGQVTADFLASLKNDASSPVKISSQLAPDRFSKDANQTCDSPEGSFLAGDHPLQENFVTLAKIGAGVTLLGFVAMLCFAYRRLDDLPFILPRPLSQRLKSCTRGLPPSKILAYRMDYWFSTYRHSKAVALMSITIVLVCCGGLALYCVSDTSLYSALWEALAGVGIDWTFAEESGGGGLTGLVTRLVATVVSVGGLLVTALMLGIVSEAIGEKVDEMKKGVSEVLESDHTLILGWSDKLLPVVNQICLANESIGGAPIVIMAERPKEEMEAEIAQTGVMLRGSRIICRSGNPLLAYDLNKVSVHLARSVIVLANHQSPDQSDARVLRIVLSLVAVHDQFKEKGGLKVNNNNMGFEGHIVAEMCDIDNEPLVKMVGRDKVETVVAHDIIGRLMIQCARQPGLAGVWEALMGFEGCEFYVAGWPELEGKQFKDVLLSFPDAVPIGVTINGEVKLNPDDSYVLQKGDRILVIAEDDDTYTPAPVPKVEGGSCPEWTSNANKEKILFCGWRRDMDDMIVVMDEFVSEGSELWLYNEVPLGQRHEMLVQGGLDPDKDLKNLTLFYNDEKLKGDLATRKKLENLDPSSFSSILILADESATGAHIADADSRNLATLLLLRDIMVKKMSSDGVRLHKKDGPLAMHLETEQKVNGMCHGRLPSLEFFQSAFKDGESTVIISEILDTRTRNLIQELNISEFVMSNELVSMVLAMVSESTEVNTILKELFTDDGNELYVFPAEKYLRKGECLSFYGLMVRVRTIDEIVIGYKSVSGSRGVVINPENKTDKTISLDSIEAVVVLADPQH